MLLASCLLGSLLPVHAAAPVRIMPVGDSITRGAQPDVPFAQANGYRGPLATRLRQMNYSVDFVGSLSAGTVDPQHEGHDGWSLDQIRASVPSWIATHRPQIILLLAGTNDLAAPNPEQMPARMAALLDTIRAADQDVEVVVSTLPPICCGLQPRVDAFNAALPSIVAGRPRVRLIEPKGLTLSDGVHLDAAGYQHLADAWMLHLLLLLGSPPVPTLPAPVVVPTSACSPRPRVAVSTVRAGTVTTVTITAQSAIQSMTFGALSNATVTQPALVGGSASFKATRVAAGAWGVHFVVTDACGPWQTMVGAGS